MRILLISPQPYAPPWAEGLKNMTRRLAQYLCNQKEHVVVVAPGKDLPPHHVGEFGEQVFHVEPRKNDRLLNRIGVWLTTIRLLRRVVKQQRPDVSLVFGSASLLLGLRMLLLRYVLGHRVVVYISGLKHRIIGVNWLMRNNEVLVGSPFLLRWFPNATIAYPLTPTHLNPQAVGAAPSQSTFSLLYLGTAQKERGVEYLLRGLALARKQSETPLKLVLAFNGIASHNHPRIEQLLKDLGVTDIVEVHGTVDINQAYRAADVVVIPRQEPIRMSFPVRILEALSFDTPLIVTTMCDMGLLVKDCGLVVDPTKPDDLAKAIVSLSDNPTFYRQLVSNCAPALQKYDPEQTLARMYSFLKEGRDV